jgi:hypothetical protein
LRKKSELSKNHIVFDFIKREDVDEYLAKRKDIECFSLIKLLPLELFLYEGDGKLVIGVEVAFG